MINAMNARMFSDLSRMIDKDEPNKDVFTPFEKFLFDTSALDSLTDIIIDSAALDGDNSTRYYLNVATLAKKYESTMDKNFPWTEVEVLEQFLALLEDYGFKSEVKDKIPANSYCIYYISIDWS